MNRFMFYHRLRRYIFWSLIIGLIAGSVYGLRTTPAVRAILGGKIASGGPANRSGHYVRSTPALWSSNLKLALPFNGNANDTSGNGSTGTVTNAFLVSSPFGQAYSFDGDGDFITMSSDIDLTRITVAAWIKNAVTNSCLTVGGKGDGGNASITDWLLLVGLSAGGCGQPSLAFLVGGQFHYFSYPAGFQTTSWHHVAATYDGSHVRGYINGVQIGSASAETDAIYNSSSTPRIGKQADNVGTNYMSGLIDEFRIYNKALSGGDIARLMSVPSPACDQTCKGYWQLEDRSSVPDDSGNGGTGTVTGAVYPGGCVYTVCLDFDGTDDDVNVGDQAALDFGASADFTISGWFYRDTFTTDDTIIAKRNSNGTGTPSDVGYIVYVDATNDKLNLAVSDGTDTYTLASTTAFTATGWNYFAVVWDDNSASNTEIYINGFPDSATKSGTQGNIDSITNSVSFRIGEEPDNGASFDGRLDDIRVYGRTFDAYQIYEQYFAGRP